MGKLTKAQKSVLKLIFEEKLIEEEALEKASISQRIYDGWFRQADWSEAFNERLRKCRRKADLMVSLFKETAACRLIQLTESGKEAVARQACLDVLNMDNEQAEQFDTDEIKPMKPETQDAIMKIMEEEVEGE